MLIKILAITFLNSYLYILCSFMGWALRVATQEWCKKTKFMILTGPRDTEFSQSRRNHIGQVCVGGESAEGEG